MAMLIEAGLLHPHVLTCTGKNLAQNADRTFCRTRSDTCKFTTCTYSCIGYTVWLWTVVKIEKFYHSILITFDTDLGASTLAPPPESCSGQTWDRFASAFANLTC